MIVQRQRLRVCIQQCQCHRVEDPPSQEDQEEAPDMVHLIEDLPLIPEDEDEDYPDDDDENDDQDQSSDTDSSPEDMDDEDDA